MTTLSLGKGGGVKPTVTIHNSTLAHPLSEMLGQVYIYDALSCHLVVRDGNLSLLIGFLVRTLDEYMEVEMESYLQNNVEGANIRLNELREIMINRMVELPIMDELLQRNFSTGWGTLYDVVSCSLKNKLLKLQSHIKKIKGAEGTI